jgi:hypothetical protein
MRVEIRKPSGFDVRASIGSDLDAGGARRTQTAPRFAA